MRKLFLLLMAVVALNVGGRAQTAITTPEAFFGFEPGADGVYASWDRLVAYYEQVDKQSDRVVTNTIGKSTLGNPFLAMTISSPQNLAKATRFQEIARQLSDPRGLTQQQTDALASEGRAVVLVSLGQHSTEVASSQTGAKLVYRLATSNDERTKAVLDNVMFVLIPGFNPDGQLMVSEWVKKTAGTPYEGSGTPDLYHHYVGHDNNRDAYMLTQIESKHWAKLAYREWYPQIYKDTHQMGSYGGRLYIPPKTDPIDPNVDPLVWRESMLLGGAMATMLEAEGITGVESQVGGFTAWQIPTFHGMANHRNIPAFHTESASARMIWPLYIHPQELQAADRMRPEYKAQMSFPHPWPGGWWRMGDIVRQQEAAIFALLETAGRHRELFLRNMAIKARRQVQLGASEAPYASVVPLRQHDPGTAAKLVATLMEANVEVHRATEGFRSGLVTFEPGDIVIRHDQPARPYIKTLLEPLIYPDNEWTRKADGTPLRPKDLASSNLGELMGVEVVPANDKITAKLEKLTTPPTLPGRVTGSGSAGWLLTPAWNDSHRAVTRILKAGGTVHRLQSPAAPWAPGTFWIPAGGGTNASSVQALAQELGVPFEAVPSAPAGPMMKLNPLRVGLYRRYQGGNIDEGWTRWVFDTWQLPYARVDANEIQKGALKDKYDIVIIPDDSVNALVGGGRGGRGELFPPEYRLVLGEAGVKALQEFARAGGTVMFLNNASDLAIEQFGIPVTNVVKELSAKEFFSPGSLLRVQFDPTHPLAYGMPARTFILNDDSPTFSVRSTPRNEAISVVARYGDRDILQSGWLDGESHIAKQGALMEVKYGAGRLVLVGFGVQRRAETHGTFKVLFNAMYLASSDAPSRPGMTSAPQQR